MTTPIASRRIRYPLLSMWIWPRAAIRDLIAKPNPLAVLMLSAAGGVFLITILVAFRAPGAGVFLHPAILVGAGAVAGIVGLYICGALMWLAGALIGGQATPREVRRALGWTTIPNSLAATLVIVPWLLWVAYGSLLHQHTPPGSDWAGLAFLLVLASPLGLWGMFVSVRAIGATLKVGALRALLCIVLVGGVIGYTVVPLADRIGSHVPSYLMPNAAMLPTIRPDERFLLSPKETLSRGDIVVFARKRRDPHYGTFVRQFVKRVVGLPGDVIAMSGGIISINGESAKRERMGGFAVTDKDDRTKLLPRFLETLPNGVSYGVLDSDANRTLGDAVHRVAADQIFLLGDNRDDADDMRDSYDARPMPAHPGLVWLDRVTTKETAAIATGGSKHP